MIEKGDVCIWSPEEIVYSVGDISNEAYLVLEGSVRIFSSDNLLLNRVGLDELFGETSLILGEDRSVNAVAGPAGLTARKVPKTYISNILNSDPVLGAFLRNTQHRLMDSNEQSMALANELEKVADQLQSYFTAMDTVDPEQRNILDGILEVVRKIERFKQGAISGAATKE
jgi:CRP-like cAMP-binding protein